jgi:hypothetical protein
LATGAGTAASATVRWRVTDLQLTDGASVSAISCVSAGSCVVVGSGARGGMSADLTDGVVANDQKVPFADAITCRPGNCVATGGSLRGFRAFRVTRHMWTRMPLVGPPSLYGEALTSTACQSSSLCFAVGNSSTHTTVDCPADSISGPICETDLPVLERWDGRRWSQDSAAPVPVTAQAAVPVASAEPFSSFEGVACVTAQRCVVVGEVWPGVEPTPTELFADTLNAGSWTLAGIPLPEAASTASLASVSCSRGHCLAVGSATVAGKLAPFAAEQQNGRWTALGPGQQGSGALTSVSCTRAGACIAVGYSGSGATERPLVDRLTGGRWRHGAAAVPRQSRQRGGSSLVGVSCVASTCTAVGNYNGSTHKGTSLGWFVERTQL